jgi:hypothetical protein
MKTKEFIETCTSNITDDLEQYWGVQRDSNGSEYVNSPFKSKEDFLKTYEAELEDPCEELEDYEDLPQEEIDRMEQAGRDEVARIYDCIKSQRKEFLGDDEY